MTRWFPVWTSLLIFGGLAVLLFSASAATPEQQDGGTGTDMRVAIAWAHVATISAILVARRLAAYLRDPEDDPRAKIAKLAWAQYRAGIDALCLHWIVLYALLAVVWTRDPGFGEEPAGRVALVGIELANSIGGLIYFFLFFVLDRPTVATTSEPGRDARFREAWLAVVAIAALGAFASAMARLERVPSEALAEVLQHASPVIVAIAMMYLFSRFDSTSMGIRPIAVAPLWGYVALQATWARASGPEDLVSTGIFALAYVLKLYFLAMQSVWCKERRIQRHLDLGAL